MISSKLLRLASATVLLAQPAMLAAAPTAVDDAFAVNEDTALVVTVDALIDADFETASGGSISLAGDWAFLDEIENENGASDGYPVDGSGRAWNDPDFETASSTVGTWSTAAAPLQAGGIEGFPGAPDVLAGLGAAGNGQNLVTTYLFRNSFTLSAAEAARTDFSARILFDDSGVVYINGTEVLRQRVGGGALTTLDLGTNNQDESQFEVVDLSIPNGLLVAGENTIAVEIHQATLGSSDAGMDLELMLGGSGPEGGFAYQDDPFGTSNPEFAEGQYEANGGFNGSGGLRARTGGGTPGGNRPSSAGWTRQFTLADTAILSFSIRYRLVADAGFENDEFIMALAEIDGARIGTDQNSSLAYILGNGNGGGDDDTGWQQASFNVPLAAGNHTLAVGVFVSKSTTGGEVADVYFDDIEIGVSGGGGGTGGVLANDTGDQGSISATLLTQPPNGSVALDSGGTFTYTPDADFFGEDTFTYRATDNTGNSSPATVTITVNPINDAPTGVAAAYMTAEDQALSISAAQGVLQGAGDVDNPAGDLTAVLDSDVSEGSLVLNPSGAFIYSPDSNSFGSDSFTYRVSDGSDQSDPLTVTLTITEVDDPPTARDDSYSVDENGQLQVTLASGGGGGETLDLVALGADWRYLDDGSDQGVGWIATTFDDSGWAIGAAELGYGDDDEVTVIDFGPDADNKYPTTYFRRTFDVTGAGTVEILTLGLLRDDGAAVYLNGSEIARSNLVAEAAFDTRTDTTNQEGEVLEFDVDPALLEEGENLLAVEVHQADGSSSDVSFDLFLRSEQTVVRGVLANDSDPEGAGLSAVVETQPGHGTLNLNPDGTFAYVPTPNYFGDDSFEYRVSDGGLTSVGSASITVVPGPNDVPETVADAFALDEDQSLSRDAAAGVLSNDSDPDDDPMTALLVTDVANGSLTLNPDGSFDYVPDGDFFGADGFVYRAVDPLGQSGDTAVTIQVNGINDEPRSFPEAFVVQPGQSFSANVLANDSDPDGEALTAVLTGDVDNGALNFSSDGGFTFDPGAFRGATRFYYEAHDATTSGIEIEVSLVVNGQPVAVADGYNVTEDEVLTVPANLGVQQNDSDPESGLTVAQVATDVSNGDLTLEHDGSFTYTPQPDYSGTDSFSYRLSDGFQFSAPATVTITVQAVNDEPVAVADDYGVITNQEFVVGAAAGVLGNDTDADGDNLQVTLVTDVTNGVLALDADGSFSYAPAADFEGDDSFTYRVSDGTADSTTTVMLHVGPDIQTVVINEIMYHPASENDLEEYIELANIGVNTVDLTGWNFGNGIDFTFPAVSLPPGEFIVVAADLATFEAAYGVIDNVVGGWAGRLSNSGERLQLYTAEGIEIDDLSYSDEGEWAARQRVSGARGWDWNSDHDGGGQSLELIFPGLSNKRGQNWAPSSGAPTPGVANSVAAASVAPLIWDLAHSPVVPKSSEAVSITAKIADEEGSTISTSLFWRDATDQDPDGFLEVVMADAGTAGDGDAGDGVYGAILPPMADGTVVEFYISASDGAETRTWPAETNLGQVANAHYQVDDEAHDGDWPIYRIVMTADEDDNFVTVNRSSNERFHTTLILDDCSGPVIRYNSSIRVRGAGSRSHNPPPMRVSVPHDNAWNSRTAMNWNTKYTYLQYVGMRLFQGEGMAAPDGKPMRVRWNGEDRMRDDEFDYGMAVHMEVLDGDFANDKYPDDPDGNLFKKTRPDRDWAWRDGGVDDYSGDGWTKETNAEDRDWSDLDTFLGVMNNAPGEPDYIAQVEAVVDLDQWLMWFGANAVLANGETNASNGADDDHSLYRGILDPRFQFLPHDLDTILGEGDGSRLENPEHTIFDMITRGNVLDPLVPLFSDPTVQVRYYQALRELLQGSFLKPEFDELINNSLIGWVPNAKINEMKSFMDARRDHIHGLIDDELGPPPPAPTATTSETLAGAHGPLMISEVLAVNVAAFDNGGTFPDYVELHNTGGSDVSLAGMSITDDPAVPAKFAFPAGAIVPAAGRLLLFADSEFAAPGIHLGFGLGSNGEGVFLMNGATVVDSVSFGLQIPDHSIGRGGPGLNTWSLNQPTPGAANTVAPLGDPNGLRLNEWLTQPEVVFERDFIEIYNPSADPVAMGGLAITDEPASDPDRFQLPALSFIPAGGFSLFEAIGNNASAGNATELPFKLGSDQGWLAISGVNGVEIDAVHYLCHSLDVSQGRSVDGGPIYADYILPTPGFSNAADLSNEAAIISGLRITELMYHPATAGLEYVELRNTGDGAIDIGGVEFTEGIRFAFPSMVLQPGEFVLVVENGGAFEAAYGAGLNVAGIYDGKLSNGGERLRLEIISLGAGIHDFEYRDSWYPSTDGGGFALEIISERAPGGTWGQRSSWRAGTATGGTPGSGGGDPAAYDNWVMAVFGGAVPGITGTLDDPDEDGVANLLEFVFGTDPNVGDRSMGVDLAVEGGFLTLTYRRDITSIGLVRINPEVSGDNLTWDASPGRTLSELVDSDGQFETWRVRDAIPITSGDRRFLRIRAILGE